MMRFFLIPVLFTSMIYLISCSKMEKVETTRAIGDNGGAKTDEKIDEKSGEMIRYSFQKGELTSLCQNYLTEMKIRLDQVGSNTSGGIEDTLLAFEGAMADLSDQTTPLVFMGYVSQLDWLRSEAEECEKKVGQFGVEVFTRKDIYQSIKGQKGRNAAEKRLLSELLLAFDKNGLKLSDEKLSEMRKLKQKLTQLETEFSANLNNDKTSLEFTAEELSGVSATFLGRLTKSKDGRYVVTTKSTDYLQVMETAVNSATRRRMMLAYNTRAAPRNTQILEEALGLRYQIAGLMGHKSWADYRATDRMAKSASEIKRFLGGLRAKLSERNRRDLNQLLAFKKQLDPGATVLEPWDLTFLSYQLKKRDFELNDEEIREYFPADFVMTNLLAVYSQLLGIKFERIPDAKVWAPGVRLYRILSSGSTVAYFFTDFEPRAGKYGHAAAFTLISGRELKSGYSTPVSAIVANFNPPTKDKPSLLNHSEVETLFHEFGHIMHQTLTRAPFASLAGTSVKQDFVEAPSQMLENWVWQESILDRLSGHYLDTNKKLPKALLKKMLASEDFNRGYTYTRQLLLGLFDYSIHSTKPPVDVTQVHNDLYLKVTGLKPLEGNRFPATFNHMMGGYDVGYYGYLWSEFFAQDLFSFFEGDLLNAELGLKYRQAILEKGNLEDPKDLLKKFLGRAPSQKAFFRKLGLKN